MQLIACPVCHSQYDVSQVSEAQIRCRCGENLENRPPAAVDAKVARCGACGAQLPGEVDDCSYCGSSIVRDPAKLSLLCPECYARNADESRFCTACGVGFSPEPLPGDGRSLPCPACESLMPPSHVAGIATNECGDCNGLWVADDQFDRLVSRAAEARKQGRGGSNAPRVSGGNPASQSLAYRRCPECDAFMLRVNYRRSSGVILDECRAHGTWLDADELEAIAGFIWSGGETSPALSEEHERVKREAGAAYVRARSQADRHRVTDPVSSGVGGSGLLKLLFDILS